MPIRIPEKDSYSSFSGWATYVDTQYTVGAPFSLPANTKTTLPNNAGSKIESQLPLDIASYYDVATQGILGFNGDAENIVVEFIAVPSVAASYLDTSIDIGGAVGEIYPRTHTHSPKVLANCGLCLFLLALTR